MVKDAEFYRWKLLKLLFKELFGDWTGAGKIQGRIIKNIVKYQAHTYVVILDRFEIKY